MTTLTATDGIYLEFHRLMQELYVRVGSYLEPLGVTRTGLSHLLYIHSHPGCKVSELVDATRLDKPAVTRSLSALGKLGFLDRQTAKIESRAFILYLTPAGKTVVKAVSGIVQEWERDLRDAVGEDDYGATLATLSRAGERFLRDRVKHTEGTSFFY